MGRGVWIMDLTVLILVAMFLIYMYFDNNDNNKYG